MRVVRIFVLIARCSKCDFRNLGEILLRYRWSKKIRSTFFFRQKNKKVRRQKKYVDWFSDFSKGFRKFPYKAAGSFIRKFPKTLTKIRKSIDIFFLPTNFFIFLTKKKSWPNFFWPPISKQNFPKIPKITLRTACDQYKNANDTHEKKVPLFLYYLPSGGSQVREPSV